MACNPKFLNLNDFFLEINCVRNEGGTRNLVLAGAEMVEKLGKRITDSDLVKIVWFLRKHQEVVALEFPYNEISDCGMSTLANFFSERPVIRHLNLVGNNITGQGLSCLVALGEHLPLFSLRLTGNKIGDDGGKVLYALLRNKNCLKYLDISDTHQTLSGLAYIADAMITSRNVNQNLEYLDIGRPLPQMYHQMNDGHAASLMSQILQDNKKLKEFHLQQYHFDFRDMEIMLEGLLFNDTLVCLDLNNNNIGDDGVDYLCKYLKTSPPLECLMIGANSVSDLGALTLSFNLPFSKIKLLDITNNHITDEGMINIFYTIEKKVKMKALFMWGNKLTHTSLVVLQRLYKSGILDSKFCDVKLFCADQMLQASWNYEANRYTQRFYCVTNYEDIARRGLKLNPRPPIEKPPIYFKYHVDNKVIGFPMCEWNEGVQHSKYYDPM